MSNDSRSDSNGSQKSMFGRMRGQKKAGTDATDTLKKGIGHLTDSMKNLGNTLQSSLNNAKKEGNVFTRGTRELDQFGYEKYNISEEAEIFISRVPDSAFFNDGDPIMVRTTGEEYVSTSKVAPVAKVAVEEPKEALLDASRLFSNVQVGEKQEAVVHGITGTVQEGKVEMSSDFLSRISGGNSNESRRPRVVIDLDEAETSVPEIQAEAVTEVPMETVGTIMDVPVPVPEEEKAPLDAFEEDSDVMIISIPEETVDVDAPVETEVIEAEIPETIGTEVIEALPMEAVEAECGSTGLIEVVDEDSGEEYFEASEDTDDDSWLPDINDVDDDTVNYLQMHSDEIQIQIGSIEADATVTAAPEETTIPETIGTEAPVEAEKTEVEEEPIVVVPSMPVSNVVEGLYVESDAKSDEIKVDATEVVASVTAEVAETSVELMDRNDSRTVRMGLDDEGAGFLPPMQDPVRRRPTAARFRFKNGVLQSVDAEKESKEGPRGPFDVTVGQTVIAELASEGSNEIVIRDVVADVMRLTMPELEACSALSFGPIWNDYDLDDEVDALCFEHWVELDDEAGVMPLVMPELRESFDPLDADHTFHDEYLEAMCFRPSPEPSYFSAIDEAVYGSVLDAVMVEVVIERMASRMNDEAAMADAVAESAIDTIVGIAAVESAIEALAGRLNEESAIEDFIALAIAETVSCEAAVQSAMEDMASRMNDEVVFTVASMPMALPQAMPVLGIAPAEQPAMIPAPVPLEAEATLIPVAVPGASAVEAPVPKKSHGVTFSFGSGAAANGSVCFSF